MDLTAALQAGDLESLTSSSVLRRDGLSNAFHGNGNMVENNPVTNGQGSYAKVGAKIINADNYTYSYTITPKNLDHVEATQSPTVGSAQRINAWSEAKNVRWDKASAEIDTRNGGLNGYTSSASANNDSVVASQEFKEIYDAEYIHAWTKASHIGSTISLIPMMSHASANVETNEGDLQEYYAESSVNNEIAKSKQDFTSKYTERIYGLIGASKHSFVGSETTGTIARANVKVKQGDLRWSGESSAGTGSVYAGQNIEIDRTNNIRAYAESRKESTTSFPRSTYRSDYSFINAPSSMGASNILMLILGCLPIKEKRIKNIGTNKV